MKLRRQKKIRENSGVPTDLAFLLIIYFLVIAGFTIRGGLPLALSRDGGAVPDGTALRFSLGADGGLFYRGAGIDTAEARALIARAVADDKRSVVFLAADNDAAWQRVVSFVDLARDLDVQTFSFVPLLTAGGAGESP
ncbi:MAG: biopolymer transporter ExbD [Treponema sp.]|nr:biopolymer transporter ExbD [Treponema sp.]